jgi:hypothetical protein
MAKVVLNSGQVVEGTVDTSSDHFVQVTPSDGGPVALYSWGVVHHVEPDA